MSGELIRRLAKLEAVVATRKPSRTVERHIIDDETDAARQARIRAIMDASTGSVLHIFRVIVKPGEAGRVMQ